ncbi:RICIN domain-containing protein [Frankia sp. R43]|uniref:RICIN domain-containing protein n=1 Tax=Frankia sp. R43 TaxID=269536 RepID=UPI0006CA5961|nr:RICIN domain-containing protein [Frankia sp. R43]
MKLTAADHSTPHGQNPSAEQADTDRPSSPDSHRPPDGHGRSDEIDPIDSSDEIIPPEEVIPPDSGTPPGEGVPGGQRSAARRRPPGRPALLRWWPNWPRRRWLTHVLVAIAYGAVAGLLFLVSSESVQSIAGRTQSPGARAVGQEETNPGAGALPTAGMTGPTSTWLTSTPAPGETAATDEPDAGAQALPENDQAETGRPSPSPSRPTRPTTAPAQTKPAQVSPAPAPQSAPAAAAAPVTQVPPATQQAQAAGGPTTLVNYVTGECLDSNEDGHLYSLECNGGPYQLWTASGSGAVALTDSATGLCLDSDGSGSAYTRTCNNGSTQQWQVAYQSGTRTFVNVASGKCLDTDSSTTYIFTGTCSGSGGPTQRWR